MDPLSDVLSLLKPRTFMSRGIDVGGPHAVQFGPHEGIKCYAIGSGRLWLSVDGVPDPVQLERGDCFLLPTGRPFRLTTDLRLTPVDFRTLLPPEPNGAITTVNGGGDALIVGGHFTFGSPHAGMLLGMLPPIVHIRKEVDKAALRWLLRRLSEELREEQPGGFLVAQNVAYLLLVQALRLYLADAPRDGVGWLFALADREMSVAISAMHAEPARRWTLGELAERVGLSRSTFALKFKATVGSSPMEYLTRWRMMLAEDRLGASSEPVGEIAAALGYESESAFSTAFKRVMGRSPRSARGDRARVRTGRDAEGAFEVARERALVGEAGRESDLGGRPSLGQQPLRAVDAHLHEIGVRRDAVPRAKRAHEVEPAQPA